MNRSRSVNKSREYTMVWQLIQESAPDIKHVWSTTNTDEAYTTALQLAKKYTQRNKILLLVPALNFYNHERLGDINLEVITSGSSAQLCRALANSNERIAAIIVRDRNASPNYYKRMRELISAEGAVIIWDALEQTLNSHSTSINIGKNCQPDIVCLSFSACTTTCWVGTREGFTPC